MNKQWKINLSDLVFGVTVNMSLLPTSVCVLVLGFTSCYDISIDFFLFLNLM